MALGTKRLQCCVCGSGTRGKQWWNRDKGYGLCPECAVWLRDRMSPEEMENSYGKPGENYPAPEEKVKE